MPAGGLSTGIDTTITFTDIDGVKQFLILESFSAKENASINAQTAIDGITRFPKFHQGWTGSFVTERSNANLDRYIALQESGYYQGVDQLPMIITQLITEIDGTVTKWKYTGVVLMLDDAGTWSGTDIVKQSVSFSAARKSIAL